MANITAFLPYIVPLCYGVPEPLAIQEVRLACRELCDRANVVQEGAAQNTVAGTQKYTVEVPASSQLVRVLKVSYLEHPLTPAAVDDVMYPVALRGAVGEAVVPEGTPQAFYQRNPSSDDIYLWPAPDENVTDGLHITAAFMPLLTADTVSDVLFTDYVTVIASRAISRLASMPGQSFTNPELAKQRAAEFEKAISEAARAARTGSMRVTRAVSPRRFV